MFPNSCLGPMHRKIGNPKTRAKGTPEKWTVGVSARVVSWGPQLRVTSYRFFFFSPLSRTQFSLTSSVRNPQKISCLAKPLFLSCFQGFEGNPFPTETGKTSHFEKDAFFERVLRKQQICRNRPLTSKEQKGGPLAACDNKGQKRVKTRGGFYFNFLCVDFSFFKP